MRNKKEYYIIFKKDKEHKIFINDDINIIGHSYLYMGYRITMSNHEIISLYCIDEELYASGFLLEDAIEIKDKLNMHELTDKWCIKKMPDKIKKFHRNGNKQIVLARC